MYKLTLEDGTKVGYIYLVNTETTAGMGLDANAVADGRIAQLQLSKIRATVEGWLAEEKGAADASYEHAQPYILAEHRAGCYQAVLDLLDQNT